MIALNAAQRIALAYDRLKDWVGVPGARVRVGPEKPPPGWDKESLPTFDWQEGDWVFVGFTLPEGAEA